MTKRASILTVLAVFLCVPATALAQEWYVGGSIGFTMLDDSYNAGMFTSDFTTGNGSPTIPDGTVIASGTPVDWATEFEDGTAFSLEAGLRYDRGLRSGIEISYGSVDVESHRGVAVGGAVIDDVDAAVLTGSSTQLGVTVGEVVAAGRGDVSSLSLFFNGYYDFNRDGKFQPYIGAGLGLSDVDVTYRPSDVGIVDDGDTVIAYQVKLGATLRFNEEWEGYADFAVRMSEDVEVRVDLFPAMLEVENEQDIFSVGARRRF